MNPWNLIPWAISLVSLLLCILTFVKNGKKDLRQSYQEQDDKFSKINEALLKVNIKLDQVCAVTNETRSDIKALNKDLTDLDKRISVIERDVQTAFIRIDELREKVES